MRPIATLLLLVLACQAHAESVVNTKYWRYSAVGCKRVKYFGVGENKIMAGGTFIVVKFTAKNMDSSPSTLRHTLFSLNDDTGAVRQEEKIPENLLKQAFGDEACACDMKEVQAGVSIPCYLVYDAPADLKGFRLEIKGGILDPGTKGYLDFPSCGKSGFSGNQSGKNKGWLDKLKEKISGKAD